MERWTGMKAEEVDHLVLGVKADERFAAAHRASVAHDCDPYNADAVRTALQAERLPDANGKTVV